MLIFDVTQNHPVLRTFVYIMTNISNEKKMEKGVVNNIYLETISKDTEISQG